MSQQNRSDQSEDEIASGKGKKGPSWGLTNADKYSIMEEQTQTQAKGLSAMEQLTNGTVSVSCRYCNGHHILAACAEDVDRWQGGELIQNAMPYLSADERELLISGTCGTCFDKMFGSEE